MRNEDNFKDNGDFYFREIAINNNKKNTDASIQKT